METILMYSEKQEKLAQVKALSTGLQMQFRAIKAEEIDFPLTYFLGGGTEVKKHISNRPMLFQMPEVLVLGGLTQERMELFLSEFKQKKIEKINLKAIVTPFNAFWSVYELAVELNKEYSAIQKR